GLAMYAIGYDIGSSSVKAALVRIDTGEVVGVVQHPETEMTISAPHPGWAEQAPETWWSSLCAATALLMQTTGVDPVDILSIGLGYQMHGLVLLGNRGNVLRPAIIWCDSRAVEAGERAFDEIGQDYCLHHLLNAPGNFTASRCGWVRDNEPVLFDRVCWMMLPGDYIAMKLTGEITTTVPALSEAMLWDFRNHMLSTEVMQHFGIDWQMIPPLTGTFDLQGKVSAEAAAESGLKEGTPLTYRAGDQPNNALALGVMNPGHVVASGGTSGVVYGIVDRLASDALSRVNSFAHVNHNADRPRIGLLLCINGAGIQYAWMRQHLAQQGTSYMEMEAMVADIAVGSDGLTILPFGNGAER
ncbi:MAG: FGGY family carbohydrate kinase, partial [Saprospiraceae bacterium]|nr:FGGY family carbohydrate kinase [Saprospiraceae bacterium]